MRGSAALVMVPKPAPLRETAGGLRFGFVKDIEVLCVALEPDPFGTERQILEEANVPVEERGADEAALAYVAGRADCRKGEDGGVEVADAVAQNAACGIAIGADAGAITPRSPLSSVWAPS